MIAAGRACDTVPGPPEAKDLRLHIDATPVNGAETDFPAGALHRRRMPGAVTCRPIHGSFVGWSRESLAPGEPGIASSADNAPAWVHVTPGILDRARDTRAQHGRTPLYNARKRKAHSVSSRACREISSASFPHGEQERDRHASLRVT